MTVRRPTAVLSFTLLVVMLGYGIVLPVMPFLIEHFGAGGRELGWMMAAYAFMQMLCAPLWGILSDRIGRKPVLALGVLGYAISLFMFGEATQFWVLFLARSLSGILSSATMAAAMAYIGDAAPAGDRSSDMGQLGAAMGVGTVVGPLVGGWLSADSLSLPFLVGAGIAFVALLLVLFALPESHKPHGAGSGQAQPGRRALWRTVLGPAGMLLLLICLVSFALTSVQGVTGLYVVDKFDFSTKQVGAVWMVMGGVTILVQGSRCF
jgi:DHA1 family multidrug resistance protein-like MFS transporter